MFRNTLEKMNAIRDEKKEQDGGFTLIELLVVVVIIGILIAIAIPLYLNYEKGAKDKSAASDVRAAITAVNQCYSNDSNTYPATGTQAASGDVLSFAGCAVTSNASSGTVLTYSLDTDSNGFTLTGSNDGGSGATYTYDSESGSGVTSN